MTPIEELVAALGLTIGTEFAILWIVTRRDPTRLLLYATLINAFTEPLAMYGYQHILPRFWLIEAVVVGVESVLLAWLLRIRYRHALALSILANGASAALSRLV